MRKVCIVAYDWRNIFENDFSQMKEKLKRDRILSNDVEIFIIDWSTKTYFDKKENIATQHIRGIFGKSRYIYDFLSIFVVPYVLLKHKFKPDFFYTLNFPLVFSSLFAKIVYKTKVLLYLSARPREIAYTRKLPKFRNVYHRICEFFAKPFVDYFFANGFGTLDYLVQVGIAKERIDIVYKDVISKDKQYIDKTKLGKVRERLGIGKDEHLFLCVGRLVAEKNYKKLIDHFLHIKEGALVIVGSGEMEDELKQYVEKRGMPDRVYFVGQVNREEIWSYFADANVFILASHSEGNPNVVREAMYMGTPVIANNIPAISLFQENVGHEILKVVNMDNRDDFLEVVNDVFKNKNETQNMIERAKKEIKKQLKSSQTLFNLL